MKRLAILIVAAGLLVGLLSMAVTANIYKNSLRTRINTIAGSIDGQRVSQLKDGSGAAADDEAYFKRKLERIKQANADSRFVYLMARDQRGQVYFLADSEAVGSEGYSPRGQAYPEATKELQSVFTKGGLLVEGPTGDSYGNWLSVLAPVIDDQTLMMTAVVGMDVPATTYAWLLGLAGGIPLLLAVAMASILYIQAQIRRRQQEHARFRTEMISIASHELRTPLTGLRWSQENLLSQKLGSEGQRRSLQIMYDSTRRLQETIEDILQLASMESGKLQRLFSRPVNIRALLEDAVTVQRLAAQRQNIEIVFADGWPDKLVVEADAQRLKRVFSNLISNAVKYSQPDTEVVIGYRRDKTEGHVISIRDHGIGIPADEQAKVWEGFYRATNTADHDVTGTGMGLYLARTIIEQHGGAMRLESAEGKGTTVFFSLPASPEIDDPAAKAAYKKPVRGE